MLYYTLALTVKSRYTPVSCFPDGNEGDIHNRNCGIWEISLPLDYSVNRDNSAYPVTLNLDPGAVNLPYEPDVDVRNYVDITTSLMEPWAWPQRLTYNGK